MMKLKILLKEVKKQYSQWLIYETDEEGRAFGRVLGAVFGNSREDALSKWDKVTGCQLNCYAKDTDRAEISKTIKKLELDKQKIDLALKYLRNPIK